MQRDIIENCLFFEQFSVGVDQLRIRVSDCLRCLDVTSECHSTLHRFRVFFEATLFTLQRTGAFCQTVPCTNHCRGQSEIDLAVLAAVDGISSYGLVNSHDENLVVGEQAFFYGFPESEAIELWAVDCFVIHGGEFG